MTSPNTSRVVSEKSHGWSLLKRQAVVCLAFCCLLAVIIGSLYWHDRQREWSLRCEQAKHRLDVAFELISREVERVRSDALFLADQEAVRQFALGDESRIVSLKNEYTHFVNRKQTYDQIRLLNLHGRELIRVNYSRDETATVAEAELQDKSDRYYFQEALRLNRDEVFVSEFDLNVEHGHIERPLKPVIRFVTPVVNDAGHAEALLALNYLGARLLRELDDSTLPGFTMLLRYDGNFLRSPQMEDCWGWHLGHGVTFASRFPNEWAQIDEMTECSLTAAGAFATRRIPLGRKSQFEFSTETPSLTPPAATAERDSIIAVAYLGREQVFAASNKLLQRLLLLAVCVFVPVAVIARYWAQATLTRQLQAQKIATSEEQLRDLSSRLLRIQEEERKAISREIHDEFGQQVTAINLDLKLANRNIEPGPAKSHLARAVNENETLLHSLHEFATRVRPAVLDDLGLRDAIESQATDFQQRTGIAVETKLEFRPGDIPNEIADHTYRLVQESLNNVLKHAEATKVWITLSIDRGDDPQFLVSVRDNGRGYQAESNGRGLGLIGIRERVVLLAGKLSITADAECGTKMEIRLPLRDAMTGEEKA